MRLNEGPFLRILHWCMRHMKATLLIALLLVGIGISLVPVIGFSFFPSAEKPQFLINVTMPLSSSPAAVDSAVAIVEQKLARHEQVSSIATNLGKGNAQIYYNIGQQSQRTNIAQIFCQLKYYDKDEMPLLLDSLRHELSRLPGATIQVREFKQGPPVNNPIELRVSGPNLDTLRSLTSRFELLMNQVPGIIEVINPIREQKSDLQLQINREKALTLGVTTYEINRTVRMAFAGLSAGLITANDGNDYDLMVTQLTQPGIDHSLDRMNTIYVASLSGALIPLRQVVSWSLRASPSTIEHYNRVRTVTLTAGVERDYNTNEATQQVLAKAAMVKCPPGYSIQAGGELEKRRESFAGLTASLVIAIFAIVAVLILSFGSLRATLIVASAIPLGLFGSIVALWMAGYTFSFTAFIGVITLVGLEVKNTIIIVDFTNQMRAAGHSIDEAIEMAREERFTPIFLTTLTAVGGLIPLVLERSDFFSPLALVLIGGLLSSLLLTRFVEPVLYKLLMR